MAPRKRKDAAETGGVTAPIKRVTRSQTRGDVRENVVVVKKAKRSAKAKPKTTPKTEEDDVKPQLGKVAEVEVDADAEADGDDEVKADADVEDDADVDVKDNGGVVHKGKTIVVEHCTQCNHFKKRAVMVKDGLTDAVPGVTVVLNPVKPRRGCFEIREEGGEPFVSLLNMKRPFQPMKELVMEDVIASIIEKIKE